ncbi:uncharacterized protein DAT39_010076, partial [Clarias magur]
MMIQLSLWVVLRFVVWVEFYIKKFYIMVFGKTMDSHKTFLKDLTISPKPLPVSFEDSEAIIAFVSAASRADRDTPAALKKIPVMKQFHVMVLGNTLDSHKTFLHATTTSLKLREVYSPKDSDVIIAFVPITSRAGTDLSAAMEKIPDGRPVVLVALHHTFDPDHLPPDSRRCVNSERVLVVDCLFHEDQGLLKCPHNDGAIRAVKELLVRGPDTAMQNIMTDQEEENQQLLQQNRTHEEAERQQT